MAVDTAAIFEPVAADLPLVEETMQRVSEVEFEWLALLVKHVLGASGKRLRPALTLLSGKIFDYNLPQLVPMAASVELLHTATLIHDDTLDKAALRRGLSTVHTVWDANTAVLFGDYMFAASAEMVSRTAHVRAMRQFAQTLGTICSGELSQHYRAHDWRVSEDEYFRRIGGKTASLFALATESGAYLSGAPEAAAQALGEYGYKLGMAFQIADDVLDLTSDEATLGKPAGGDLMQGTVTLPAIRFIADAGSQNPIRRFLEAGRPAEELPAVLDAVRDSAAPAEAMAVAQRYVDEALEAVHTLPEGPALAALETLAVFTLERRA